jgi:hypothetical protein
LCVEEVAGAGGIDVEPKKKMKAQAGKRMRTEEGQRNNLTKLGKREPAGCVLLCVIIMHDA